MVVWMMLWKAHISCLRPEGFLAMTSPLPVYLRVINASMAANLTELGDGAMQVKCKSGSCFSPPYAQGRYNPQFKLNTIEGLLTGDAREAIFIL